ncbi:MAG: glycosyltransferase family 2 protein [Gammaproteobacteria bacterium]|nr:glycosyltransferase family 2 protein [Gammaproteobacteria bacterium]
MDLSVVIPVFNEQDNIRPLVEEIVVALGGKALFEIVYVNDGSTDGTREGLLTLQQEYPVLRVLHHAQSCGQSTAIHTGVTAARADIIATLDGDGQNDPADIPNLLAVFQQAAKEQKLALVAGYRKRRQDSWIKLFSSRVANAVRSRLLSDATPDTGCGLKVFSRTVFLRLPYFDHMHRYLPALVLRDGGTVQSVEVNHRPRLQGISKYGIGNRLWVGIVDMIGVRWLQRRSHVPVVTEEPSDS